MSLSARDRKILIVLIPVALVAAYWLLVLAPKRKEASSLQTQLTQAQGKASAAASKLAQLRAAKNSFADDYATVLELGKSIPSTLDMPSLLYQLNSAAVGTGIDFTSIQSGARSSAPGSSSSSPGSSGGSSSSSSSSSSTAPAAASSSVPGLDSVPLTLEFVGPFDRLADFLHRLKRFVQVVNGHVKVSGRLMTINSLTWQLQPNSSTQIQASVGATVYLAPQAQGTTAGASPSGPAGTATGGAPGTPTSSTSTSTSSAPTAAVTR